MSAPIRELPARMADVIRMLNRELRQKDAAFITEDTREILARRAEGAPP